MKFFVNVTGASIHSQSTAYSIIIRFLAVNDVDRLADKAQIRPAKIRAVFAKLSWRFLVGHVGLYFFKIVAIFCAALVALGLNPPHGFS